MVKRIIQEGHAVGNHTWSHINLKESEFALVDEEIRKTEERLEQIIGYRPSLFRAPYGAVSSLVLETVTNRGYSVIGWSVDSRDWAGEPSQQIVNTVERALEPGGIILQHCADDRNNTLEALPQIIAWLKREHYSLETVPELLNIPAAKG